MEHEQQGVQGPTMSQEKMTFIKFCLWEQSQWSIYFCLKSQYILHKSIKFVQDNDNHLIKWHYDATPGSVGRYAGGPGKATLLWLGTREGFSDPVGWVEWRWMYESLTGTGDWDNNTHSTLRGKDCPSASAYSRHKVEPGNWMRANPNSLPHLGKSFPHQALVSSYTTWKKSTIHSLICEFLQH